MTASEEDFERKLGAATSRDEVLGVLTGQVPVRSAPIAGIMCREPGCYNYQRHEHEHERGSE